MQKKKTGSLAYLGALKNLTHIINAEYRNGGKLPGAIEMCKRLDVCMVTYIKILKILCKENLLIASKGRCGTSVVPLKERACKIGIVIQNAEDSPFLADIPIMTAVLSKLHEERFALHMLQAVRRENVYDKAVYHAVSGLIWFSPDEKVLSVIEKIQKETEIPIMISGVCSPRVRHSMEEKNLNSVTGNLNEECRVLAECVQQRKHRSVLRIDQYYEFSAARLIDAFADNGIVMTPEHYLLPENVEKHLVNKLRELESTLIIADGGFMVYKQICDILNTLPKKNRPELIIRNAGNLPADGMKKLYPGIKIIGKMMTDYEQIGRVTAMTMAEHLRDKVPIGQKSVNSFSIQPI